MKQDIATSESVERQEPAAVAVEAGQADGNIFSGMTAEQAAWRLLTDFGFSVIPLKPRDKVPFGGWKKYQFEKPTEDQMDAWAEEHEGCNWGVITGKISGLAVFDADGPEAIDWAKAHLPVPVIQVATSQGYHFYYRYPEDDTFLREFSPKSMGIPADIRREGGYVVAPQSVHPSGEVYTIRMIGNSWADAPEFAVHGMAVGQSGGDERDTPIPKGNRNNWLTSQVGRMIAQGMSRTAVFGAAKALNTARCQPPLSLKDVTTIVDSIWTRDKKRKGQTGEEADAPLRVRKEVGEWGQVERFTRPRPDPLPMSVFDGLPAVLKGYALELARNNKIAPEYALSICLCARAASIHGYVFVSYNIGDDPDCLFCVPILRSGERKTTGLKRVLECFAGFEKRLRIRHKKIVKRVGRVNDLVDVQISALKKRAGKEEEDAGMLEKEYEALAEKKISVPDSPRFIAQSVTPEKLMALFAAQRDRIAILGTEDDFLSILDGRYSGQPIYSLACKAHDKEHASLDRVRDGGVELSADPVMTMFCPVQPVVLAKRKHKAAARECGFDARTLYFLPPSGVGKRGGIPTKRPVYDWEGAFFGLLENAMKADPVSQRIEDLEQWLDTPAADRVPWVEPRTETLTLQFSGDALAALVQTSEELELSIAPGAANSDMPDFVSRSTSRIARTAAIIHSCAKGWDAMDSRIGMDAIKAATEIELWAIQQQRFVRTHLLKEQDDKQAAAARDREDTTTGAHRLLGRLLVAAGGRDRIPWREAQQCWKRAFRGVSVDPLLNELSDRGYVQLIAPAVGTEARRPSIALHPDAARLVELVDPDDI